MSAVPIAFGVMLTLAVREPAAIDTDAGTVATAVFDDASVTIVATGVVLLNVAVSEPELLTRTFNADGESATVSGGIVIAPLTSVSPPLVEVSFVAALPPASVS